MTYNVFGGTLNLTQSVTHTVDYSLFRELGLRLGHITCGHWSRCLEQSDSEPVLCVCLFAHFNWEAENVLVWTAVLGSRSTQKPCNTHHVLYVDAECLIISVTPIIVAVVVAIVVAATLVGNVSFCKPLSTVQQHIDNVAVLPTHIQVNTQGPHFTKIMKPPLKLPPNMAADSLR